MVSCRKTISRTTTWHHRNFFVGTRRNNQPFPLSVPPPPPLFQLLATLFPRKTNLRLFSGGQIASDFKQQPLVAASALPAQTILSFTVVNVPYRWLRKWESFTAVHPSPLALGKEPPDKAVLTKRVRQLTIRLRKRHLPPKAKLAHFVSRQSPPSHPHPRATFPMTVENSTLK